MPDKKPAVEIVLEERITFLHKIGKFRKLYEDSTTQVKKALCSNTCGYLFGFALDLRLSDMEMPDSESKSLLYLIITDGYQAQWTKRDFGDDWLNADLLGGKDHIVKNYFDDVTEIIDRVAIRYEKLYNMLKSVVSVHPE
jgi:hypothetical protein